MSLPSDFRRLLEQGLAAIGLNPEASQVERSLAYLELLRKWNRAHGLVADARPETLLGRHLLDSLVIHGHVSGAHVVDAGSGAGFPGIPLAIFKPGQHFTLIDSNGRKSRFLFHVKTQLQLVNVTVENCRVEHYQSTRQIDMVTCRAFAALDETVARTGHLLSPESRLLAMKGRFPEQEIKRLPKEFRVVNTVRLSVPGGGTVRHIVELSRNPAA